METAPRGPFFLAHVSWMVACKELRASLRDRNTVLYSLILPLCMYPVLFWAMIQVALVVQGRREQTTTRLEVIVDPSLEIPEDFARRLEGDGGVAPDKAPLALEIRRQSLRPGEARAQVEAARDEKKRRDTRTADATLWIGSQASELYYESTEQRSRMTKERATKRLEEFVERGREKALVARQASLEPLYPFEELEVDVAPSKDKLAYVLSFILPMLLVTMCVLGAFFPAVDLTAGERERSTEETTLLVPAPRFAVHQGKILAVCVTAVLATACNLFALGLSASHLLSMLGAEFASGFTGIPAMAFLAVAPLAVLFSFFVAAVLTGVASFARTFKEGQALLGPAQLVFILPAMIGVVPGVELNLKTAAIPVVNVVLAFRGLLQGRMQPQAYMLTILSLLLFAVLSIRLSVWLLSREQRPSMGRFKALRRSRAVPSATQSRP